MERSTWRKLFKLLKAQGLTVEFRGHHYAVLRRGERIATLPGSASDHRTYLNCLADLRRAGVQVPR